jgi:hypothetical protein
MDPVALRAMAEFGAAHTSESISLPVLPPLPSLTVGLSDTSFAFGLRGGLEVGLSRRFAWRIGGDYLQTRLFQATQNNFRMTTGIVLRF